MKFFLISDSTDTMMGMRLAGIESVKATTAADAEKAFLDVLKDENVGILMITDGIANLCPGTVKTLRQGNHPLLVTIPDGSDSGEKRDSITEYIREAIGIKL